MGISPYLRKIRAHVGNELLPLPSVTALIFDGSRRVLLVRSKGSEVWTTPGGAIEPHERPADAVVREAWEETGLRVKPIRLIGIFGGPELLVKYPNGDQITYTTAVFECTFHDRPPLALDGEIAEFRWISRDDLPCLDVPVWVSQVLDPAWEPSEAAFFVEPEWQPPQG
jgi:8-oxo-dGTP pyrophosphatase MutT (NUDIX family)